MALLLSALACSDMGPRDRSLLARAGSVPLHPEVFREKERESENAAPSVIGLAADALALHYPASPTLVVRLADIATLEREFNNRLEALHEKLPSLGLFELPPADMLRTRCNLPEDAVLDRLSPIGFVHTAEGWVALIPVRGEYLETDRLRRLDSKYAVTGSPEAIDAYTPAFEKGFYLPGAVSVMATGEARKDVVKTLHDAAAMAGMKLPAGMALSQAALENVARIDVAMRFEKETARVDLRLAPLATNESALTRHLQTVSPGPGGAHRWLPEHATVEINSRCDAASWVDLARLLGIVAPDSPDAGRARELFAVLGDNASFQLHHRDGRSGVALLVAELATPDRQAAQSFLTGKRLPKLLEELAGEDGRLVYRPVLFERHGVTVGTITGSLSRSQLSRWRARGGVAATVADALSGPVLLYVALSDTRLCLALGERAREDMEALLDRMSTGQPRRMGTADDIDTLLRGRLLEVTLDGAGVLRGLVPSARYWHEHGDRLKQVPFEDILPIDLAVGSDGGALRISARVSDAVAADVAVKIRDVLTR